MEILNQLVHHAKMADIYKMQWELQKKKQQKDNQASCISMNCFRRRLTAGRSLNQSKQQRWRVNIIQIR